MSLKRSADEPRPLERGVLMGAPAWWQDSVVYQIYPRSFQDSNGDGIGDLAGIMERADYLTWLGVDAVWFSPFFVSPMADFGYDISNFTDIDRSYGSLSGFDEMVAALHGRGIKVILDFVPNHSSNRHPWFLESRSSRKSPGRDWYTWRNPSSRGGPPNNWLSLAGGPAWEFDGTTRQYYLHSFLKEQPDLNWRNPAVREAMHGVMRFWLDRSVDGFRIDAIGCLAKDPRFHDNPPNPNFREGDAAFQRYLMVNSANRPEVMDRIAEMRRVADAYGDKVLIGETYLKPAELAPYYGEDGNGLDLPFNFNLLWTPWRPAAIAEMIETYEAALPAGAWPDWVLGNHDQSRIATRLGEAQARIAMILLLTLRGTPFLYYGDELGLPDITIPKDRLRDPFDPGAGQGRDPQRCPMPWDETPKAGFTTGEPWLPIGADGRGRSVEGQRKDKSSMLALTRALLSLRRKEPALSRGAWSKLRVKGKALAYARSLDGKRLVIALNLSDEARSISFSDPLSGRIVLSTHDRDRRERVCRALDLRANEGLIIKAV